MEKSYHSVEEVYNTILARQKRINRFFLKGKRKKEEEEISKLENWLDEICMLPYAKALEFFLLVLTEREQKEYQIVDLKIRKSVFDTAMSLVTGGSCYRTDYQAVSLITTKEHAEMIRDFNEMGKIETHCDIFNLLEDNQYMLLEKDTYIPLFDFATQKVSCELTGTYSYFSDIIMDFVQCRLMNPEVTEDQAITMTLDKISSQQKVLECNNKLLTK